MPPTEDSTTSKITFIQFDEPPLKSGTYTVTVNQTTNTEAPNAFQLTRQFAVSGERFSFAPGQIDSVFPPDLANGEFDGCLPHVVFNRKTLPWERDLDESDGSLPWLAVLLFNEDEAPPVQKMQAADLIKLDEAITVAGNPQASGKGRLPSGCFSYPGINPLDYGEIPDDVCNVIDVPVAVFSKVAPSRNDMAYLAHIRQVDKIDSVSNQDEETSQAIVLGNRIPQNDKPAYAFLVSLENMGPYLPADDGTPAKFPDKVTTIRLITYRSWRFTANTLEQTFQKLLENLNSSPTGSNCFTTLQYPYSQQPPTAAQVQAALAAQAAGQLSPADAQNLAINAFTMGYVPMNHQMRHAAHSVSWYRGPCVPYCVQGEPLTLPMSCPDAANRYDPQTGLFDVSYGAAWQLGQLLTLQNTAIANALYNWKKSNTAADAVATDQAKLQNRLPNITVFASLLKKRAATLQDSSPQPPDMVVQWLSRLRLLQNVPLCYLVPDERMLPLESLRFFYLDTNWIDALVDGAFSIGRSCTGDRQRDQNLFQDVNSQASLSVAKARRNRKTALGTPNASGAYTGFLLRSQVLAGWPNIRVHGYAAQDGENSELNKLRMEYLSRDLLICIFDGEVAQVVIHEPPEQLHSGVEASDNGFITTLRAVTGDKAGSQLKDSQGNMAVVTIPMHADPQTLRVSESARKILDKLNTDFKQGITQFTSAEFALEMVKGVVKVDFNKQ
jgi:hypothetical protein